MCGITGFISKDHGTPVERRQILLDQMCALIRHRGPDEQGMVVRDRAALGMRRLSIIDVKAGQQPIFNEDSTLAIVFNGEIYNYGDLKKDLENRGHCFTTNSDTETILHAFEEFGPGCLERLRGMFAFAIWDFAREELFLARDRVGKKPLFYAFADNGDLYFASEIKSLLAAGQVDPEVDLGALDSYLTFGYVPESFCIFKNIRKLLPGHFLIYKPGSIRTQKYWDFTYEESDTPTSEQDYIEELRACLEEAVKIRMISEVPLGAFLSGGIDSASVVAMMARSSTSPVKTFSIGFDEDSFDELKYARRISREFGTEHHEFKVTPDLVNVVDDLIWHFDEPFADSSALPTFMVSKLARQHVTVALSGDGGDELFAGYTRYPIHFGRAKFERIPNLVRRHVLGTATKFLPHGAWGKNYLYNVSLNPAERYIDSISQFSGQGRKALYSKELRSRLNGEYGKGEREFRGILHKAREFSDLEQLMYLDSKTYLPSDILTKVDRMSMANSLECRSPLLDHKLIEIAGRLPATVKMRNGQTKYILKRAMEGILPYEILDRPKQGFGVPINEWINKQLASRIRDDLSDPRTLKRNLFNQHYIQRLQHEHDSGRRDHAHRLWLLWVLELWLRRYVDSTMNSVAGKP